MKTKTAAIILNHNLPIDTDELYNSLKPYERDDYDLMVFDNGSPPNGRAVNTTHVMDKNLYFGGGFNAAMKHVIDNEKYDSLLFLNNDLIIYPYNFVSSLRHEMFWTDGTNAFDIISPSVYNVEGKMYWRTMHNFSSRCTREVPYVDFQCPLISRRLITVAKEIDPYLIYGWGICFWFALLSKDRGWKIGVSDKNCIVHKNSRTLRTGAAGITLEAYSELAQIGEIEFFKKIQRLPELRALKELAENYVGPNYNNL